jgi:UDP-2,3-diacylglucosamine pyrophosphatase LpxH
MMSGDYPEWDYLFVSDLHLSLGYDPERRAYHPREDFFFDEAFFRWLRWADENCAEGRRWELVFVGDTFDFFPVDRAVVAQYFQERDRRQKEIDPADPWGVARYWQRQFSKAAPAERVPERIQRLIFEDDVLEGQVRLEALSFDRPTSMSLDGTTVPAWAASLYARYRPEVAEADVPLALRAPLAGEAEAFWVSAEEEPTLTPGERRRQARARHRDEEFERRYGFLPNPESSADKLHSIYQGHPRFFRALAWFVGQGHRVVFLRGNHDLEIFWPRVQERLREFVAREHSAAFAIEAGQPLPPGFEERIDFRPGWFYYRRGIFYAEHGSQYELLNACPNPIRPLLPGDDRLLNPDVGGLGVICLHNHLESAFPEWENRGDCAVALLDLIRRYPFKMLAILIRHAPDFLRMAQRLWLAGKEKDQEPTEGDCARYAASLGLEPTVVRKIYRAGDTPFLLRRPLAWLLFSPGGHVVKVLLLLVLAALLIGAGALWYLVVAPALADRIPADLLFSTVGPALQILAKILLWLAPPAAYAIVRRRVQQRYSESFLFDAARCVHEHLREQDLDLRYYILGHDHQADTRPMEQKGDGRHVYYLNTGSWTPCFAEGKRRLQTLGREIQFTFTRLAQGEHGYEADLLCWNDDAGRADLQITPPAQPGAEYKVQVPGGNV